MTTKNYTPNDRLLTKKQVLELIPYSACHLYRLISKGAFPKQCRCSSNRVAWSAKEVHAWIQDKIDARNNRASESEDV